MGSSGTTNAKMVQFKVDSPLDQSYVVQPHHEVEQFMGPTTIIHEFSEARNLLVNYFCTT